MKIEMIPRNIKWKTEPIPKAETISPESQIIVFKILKRDFEEDKETLMILSPAVHKNPMYKNYWMDEKKQLWASYTLENVCWDWWKSYHKEEET